MLPDEGGPTVALDTNGQPRDIFDVTDLLASRYSRIYVVDLDGIERDQAQLDFLQELARDSDIWVDAGVKTADQAIDILVTGARRAVLSSAYLEGPKQLRKAWKLSTDLVFQIEFEDGHVAAPSPEWEPKEGSALAALSREVGINELVLSPRDGPVDWSLVSALAPSGPVWVNGRFDLADEPRLQESGAAGGIFHIGPLLEATPKPTM